MTRALELFLTGEPIDEARRSAVVVVVADDRRRRSLMSSFAQPWLAEAKRLIRQPLDFGELERLSAKMFAGDEAREGMQAFLEKRPPAWAR